MGTAMNKTNTQRWKDDIAESVDLYNQWFLEFAPKAYLETRLQTTEKVEHAFLLTADLHNLTVDILRNNPTILPTLRMSTCPPLARDRLINLASVSPNLVKTLESGKLPVRMKGSVLADQLGQIIQIIKRLLDPVIVDWLSEQKNSHGEARTRAASVVADRLCGSEADPIIRNAQEQRQLALLENWLRQRGYQKIGHQKFDSIADIPLGFFGIRYSVPVERQSAKQVQIPVDLIVRPFKKRKNEQLVLIEAKSAGDYANVNKRRKEEAQKMSQLKREYGDKINYILFLCGYFDAGYLGYEASEGIDWVWEHRIDDLANIGL